jgi:hypothetical protein
MMSDEFPQGDLLLCHSVTRGAPWPKFNKMNIFSPNHIHAANFSPGRHYAAPEGNIVAPVRDEMLLLHYKYLGFERTQRRHEQCRARQRNKDLAMGWGREYSWSREELLESWNQFAGQIVDISQPDLTLSKTHAGRRWWDRYKRAEAVPLVPASGQPELHVQKQPVVLEPESR